MATGDTAPPLLSIPPPPIEPLSDDDGSSPLSDVEDKDPDTDDLRHLVDIASADRDGNATSPDDLSDANDTEAETERLYDTPQTTTRHKEVILEKSSDVHVFEHTPIKLRHHSRFVHNGEAEEEDDEPLSDEDVSMVSSPLGPNTDALTKLQSPPLDILAEAANQEAENRKRKRSPMPIDNLEPEQPPRKRTGSLPAPTLQKTDGDNAALDEEGPSPNITSGEHSADEAMITIPAEVDDVEAPPESRPEQDVGPRKQTRSSSRRLKDTELTVQGHLPTDEGLDVIVPEEDGPRAGEDDHVGVDADDEAGIAHRNEEEMERKKTAFEQLSEIDKRFSVFRERLYETRLADLNREEEMLRSENPTHPEYLAMMQCIDARRDEKLRVADRELELKMESLERWAVAKRAQIQSQFYQSVRDSREVVLAELGQRWYDVQQIRRKSANTVHEFGIRFPPDQAQRMQQALAYNKEVSILSGVAKYKGMPAAPEMRGAGMQEMEDDLEAMNRGRQHMPRHHPLPRPHYADYSGLPFADGLGPAGEQFLEQTPWANPNHPAHAALQLQHSRPPQPSEYEAQDASNDSANKAHSDPRRHTHQQHSTFSISSASQPINGNSKAPKSIPRQVSVSPEVTRAANVLHQTKARSLKATANN